MMQDPSSSLFSIAAPITLLLDGRRSLPLWTGYYHLPQTRASSHRPLSSLYPGIATPTPSSPYTHQHSRHIISSTGCRRALNLGFCDLTRSIRHAPTIASIERSRGAQGCSSQSPKLRRLRRRLRRFFLHLVAMEGPFSTLMKCDSWTTHYRMPTPLIHLQWAHQALRCPMSCRPILVASDQCLEVESIPQL